MHCLAMDSKSTQADNMTSTIDLVFDNLALPQLQGSTSLFREPANRSRALDPLARCS